jgi:hypothetical protein
VIAIAILAVNEQMAALFLSDARHAHRRGCNSRTAWQQNRSCSVLMEHHQRLPAILSALRYATCLQAEEQKRLITRGGPRIIFPQLRHSSSICSRQNAWHASLRFSIDFFWARPRATEPISGRFA